MTQKSLFTKNQIAKVVRLHFWSADKSCYVVTNNQKKAIESMKDEYNNVSMATGQLATNNILSFESCLSDFDSGSLREQLKTFLEDVQKGCQTGMISEFIYNSDCKIFYIKHIDDLEEMKKELEENFGEPIANRNSLPHYTFMCWLCFEEYCYDLYRTLFEDN